MSKQLYTKVTAVMYVPVEGSGNAKYPVDARDAHEPMRRVGIELHKQGVKLADVTINTRGGKGYEGMEEP